MAIGLWNALGRARPKGLLHPRPTARGMGTAAVRRTSRGGACVKRYGPRFTLNDDDYDEVLSAGEAPANMSAYKTGSRASPTESHRITCHDARASHPLPHQLLVDGPGEANSEPGTRPGRRPSIRVTPRMKAVRKATARHSTAAAAPAAASTRQQHRGGARLSRTQRPLWSRRLRCGWLW